MRVVAVLAVCALLLLLVPLLRLAGYAIPWYDDYYYGQFVKDYLDVERSVASAVSGAINCLKVQWYAWQGTFSSIFFMSLVPSVWGDQYYFWGPVFLILILAFSVWVLTGTLLRNVLKSDRANSIVLQALVTGIAVEFIYSAQQGFYWYNGGVHYVGMHSFLLLLIASWVSLATCKSRVASAAAMVWSFVGAMQAGGANYVTALQGMLVGLSIVVLGACLRKKRVLLLVPSLMLYGFCFYVSATAPGNNVRGDALDNYLGGGMAPIIAIIYSFKEAAAHLEEFTGPATLVMLLLAFPVVRNVVRKQSLGFRYPGLLLAWSVCLYAAGFTPTLFVLGHGGFDRTLNAVKLTYQLLLVLNFVYWTGWVCRKRREAQNPWKLSGLWERFEKIAGIGQNKNPMRFYLLIGILLSVTFYVEENQAGNYSSYGAYYYIHTGEANEFYKEYLARVEKIKKGGDIVVVDAYHFRPWFLRIDDLSEDASREENQAIARWYEKDAVYCRSLEDGHRG